MEEEGKDIQGEELNSLLLQKISQEANQNRSALPVSAKELFLNYYVRFFLCCQPVMLSYSPQQAAESKNVPMQPFSSIIPKVFSAVLHPTLPPGPSADPQTSTNSPNLQQLQTELRDLRDQFEQMKSQHKYGFIAIVSVQIFLCQPCFSMVGVWLSHCSVH